MSWKINIDRKAVEKHCENHIRNSFLICDKFLLVIPRRGEESRGEINFIAHHVMVMCVCHVIIFRNQFVMFYITQRHWDSERCSCSMRMYWVSCSEFDRMFVVEEKLEMSVNILKTRYKNLWKEAGKSTNYRSLKRHVRKKTNTKELRPWASWESIDGSNIEKIVAQRWKNSIDAYYSSPIFIVEQRKTWA